MHGFSAYIGILPLPRFPCTQLTHNSTSQGPHALWRKIHLAPHWLMCPSIKSPCCHLMFIFSTSFLLMVDCSSLRVLFVRHLKEYPLRGSSHKRSPYKYDQRDGEIWFSWSPTSNSWNMFSKSLRAAFIALTVLAGSISATQSLSVKLTGMFQVSLHMWNL